MIRFMLLGSQRTGSTFISDCLDSHPQVSCLSELFAMTRVAPDCYASYVKASVNNRILHYAFRGNLVKQYLDRVFSSTASRAVGFKFMYSQARRIPYQFPQVLRYARESDLKIVHLTRKNHLRTLISRETAMASNVYHATREKTVSRIKLDTRTVVPRLKKMIREEDQWHARLQAYDHICVSYEEFVSDRIAEGDRICNYLGVDIGFALSSRLVKLNPPDMSEVVANFEQLVPVLEKAGFAQFVD